MSGETTFTNKLRTSEEVAEILNISKHFAYKLMREETLPNAVSQVQIVGEENDVIYIANLDDFWRFGQFIK